MIRVTDEEVRSAKEGELLIVERSRKTPANPNRLKVGVYYLYNGVTKSLTSLLQLTGSIAWGQITGNLTSQTDLKTALDAKANDADISLVGKSNSYDDLDNKPTIPAAQVNSDWNAVSGVAQILNKPTIPAAQIQSDWNQANNLLPDFIKNKPVIPTVPTDVSAFVNDAGYITLAQSRAGGYVRFFADYGNTSVNTNTSNNVLGAVLIPANTITGNAMIEIESAISRAVAGANPLHRLMINTSNSFTGATQIAGISTSTTALWAKGERTFKAQTGILRGYNSGNYQGIDDISNANAPTQTVVDWTVDQYILTVANNATGETTTHEYTTVKVLYP